MDARGSGLPGSSRRKAATVPRPGTFSTPCSDDASSQAPGVAAECVAVRPAAAHFRGGDA